MTRAFWGITSLLVVVSAPLPATAQGTAGDTVARAESLDDSSRAELVASCLATGDYASAYYHAAWLTWLGTSVYAESDVGAGVLRNQAIRDRAARSRPEQMLPITLAAEADRLVYRTCFNAAIAQQAPRLRRDVEALRARAEDAATKGGLQDPVVHMALAHLALTLDSVMMLEVTRATDRERVSLLRSAASRAGAVAEWQPTAPGAHRLLAIVRARLAEIDNRPTQWELAIQEATRAFELDPTDPSLAELLWGLHLRAGHWAEARVWEARVKTASASCAQD